MSSGELAIIGLVCFICAGILNTNGASGSILFNLAGAIAWAYALYIWWTKERKQ